MSKSQLLSPVNFHMYVGDEPKKENQDFTSYSNYNKYKIVPPTILNVTAPIVYADHHSSASSEKFQKCKPSTSGRDRRDGAPGALGD